MPTKGDIPRHQCEGTMKNPNVSPTQRLRHIDSQKKMLVRTLAVIACTMYSISNALGRDSVQVIPLTNDTQPVLTPTTLGVIVNLSDPDSVSLGEFYIKARGIPRENLIGLRLPRANFVNLHLLKRELAKLAQNSKSSNILAFALAFDRPYRVDANQSITSVFAQGDAQIKWIGNCNLTVANPDAGLAPGAKMTAKPAMLLNGGQGLQSSIDLIDRGKSSDATNPAGELLLVVTNDLARSSPREASMKRAELEFPKQVRVVNLDGTSNDERPLIGYQIGKSNLSNLARLRFLPGAYADHLTSSGGALNDNKGQTTISEIIRSGATASYGTVREPCNFAAKFPDPERMARNVIFGDTLLEAYWKSVAMATEGLLIGEPLARPFSLLDVTLDGDVLRIRSNEQTLPYLESFHSSQDNQVIDGDASRREYKVDLFEVQTGRPELISSLTISASSVPGELISTLPVEATPENLMLGLLAR